MAEEKDDQAFKDYLQGNSELSRRYRAGEQPQPPKHLDDAIISAAKKAAASKPRPMHGPFGSHWYVPLSLAAVLVICVGIVFTIYDERGHQILSGPAPGDLRDSEISAGAREDKAAESAAIEHETMMQEKIKAESGRSEEFSRQLEQAASKAEIPPPATVESITPGKELSAPAEARRESSVSEPVDAMMTLQKNSDLKESDAGPTQELGGSISADTAISPEMEKQDIPMRAEPNILYEQDFEMGENYIPINDPEQWFAEINHLWDAGRKEEALTTLDHFMQMFPDYPHDALRDKLRADIDLSKHISN